MQRAMDRVDGFLRRHRRFVFLAWVALILVAVPFAARQTEHLSSGGFGVPGSASKNVSNELGNFSGIARDPLAVVLRPRDRSDRSVRAALTRVERIVGAQSHVELTAAAKKRALAQAG